MMLARRFALNPALDLHRELGRVLEDVFERPFGGAPAFPAINVWEDGDKLVVEAEVPGLTMQDLELLVDGRELTIKGRRGRTEETNVAYHRQERTIGEFTRFLTLPFEVESEGVEATLRNGVLTIILPKAERARARKIAVKSA